MENPKLLKNTMKSVKPTKLSYVSGYNSARRVHLADSNYLIDDRSGSFGSSHGQESFCRDYLTCPPGQKTEWKYKKRKSLAARKKESAEIFRLYPDSVPIILEKYQNNGTPTAQKEKYLVPKDLSVSELVLMVRNNMFLNHDMSVYLMSGNGILHSSLQIGDVFAEEKDEDGFLYLTYSAFKSFDYSRSISHGRAL